MGSWLERELLGTERSPTGTSVYFQIAIYLAIKALGSNMMYFKKVWRFRRYLYDIAERYDIHIVRVPEHSDIPDNCRADELSRRCMNIELSDELSNLAFGDCIIKLIIDNAIVDSFTQRWAASDAGRTACKI